MKYLTILFLFFSSGIFSQSYYPLDKTNASDIITPSNPVGLTASNITETTVNLSWSSATDNIAVTNYKVYNNGNLLIATGNVTRYKLTGLTPETTYNITVRAIDEANNESNDSNIESFSTLPPPDTEKPTAPFNLIANNVTQNTVDLSWTAATDNIAVTNYKVYNNGNLLIATGNVTRYKLTGLTPETNYNITVRAIDEANNESSDSNIESFNTLPPPDTERPTIPINLIANNVTQNTVDLSWTAATDNIAVTNYKVYNNGNLLIATGNVTSYTLNGLTTETTYNITVRAIDEANNESSDSNIESFNTLPPPDTERPTAPINLLANNITQNTVDLSWTAATDNVGVTNYRVYNSGALIAETSNNTTSFTVSTLTPETTYNITVRAIDEAGNSSLDSNKQTFETDPIILTDSESPTQPTNLIVSNITTTSANLTWNQSTDNIGVTYYRVYNNSTLLINSTGNVTSYTLTNLTPETLYNLSVRAVDAGNNESNDSNFQDFNTLVDIDTERPTSPINFFVDNITETTADLSWSAATDNIAVTNYKVYNNGNLLADTIGNVTSYTLTGLNTDTSYNLTIRAIDEAGNPSLDSNKQTFTTINNIVSDTERPTSPINFFVDNITQTTADLSWSAATDNIAVTNYKIYNNGNVLVEATGTVTSYTLTGLNPETTYNLSIRAIDEAGNSSLDSNKQIFTTINYIVSDTERPTSPLNFFVDNITQTTADLSWFAATDNIAVTNYKVYNNGNILVEATGTVTSYTLTGLNPETTYNLSIRAIDEAGNPSLDSNKQTFTTTTNNVSETARFVMIGSSLINSVFSLTDNIKNSIETAYPEETVEVFNEAINEATTSVIVDRIDDILVNYSPVENVTTYFVIHIGGDNVTQSRPYSNTSISYQTQMTDDISYIIDAIEAKGFTPILCELTFRNYDNDTYLYEEKGSAPYNENIIKPLALSRTPNFAFSDGTPFFQGYNLVYNDYETFLSDNNINLIDAGNTAFKAHFVNSICKFIFTGEEPERIEKKSNSISELDENTPPEIEYFDTYYLPPSESSTLQNAIDTYGAVRLGPGDYKDTGDIKLKTNQRLYGWLGEDGTKIGGNIIITQGSSNVHIENVDANFDIIFEAGSPITNCTLQSIYYSNIRATNAKLENNTFLDLSRVETDWDCSTSGYFRNNIFIKAFQQAFNDHVTMIGNDITPSYGNIEISRNLLTSSGNTTNYDNLKSHTMLGLDAEWWAAKEGANANAAFYFRNIGRLNLFNLSGYSSSGGSEFDIEADELIMSRKGLGSLVSPNVRANTNFLSVESNYNRPTKEANVWELLIHHKDNTTELNNTDISNAITGSDATILENLILGPKYTPIPKPNLPTIPNPTKGNWKNDRIGKTDQSESIQALIDKNGVAELEEGIYYISKSLIIKDTQGIIGKGTGKTAIVGITDDFPLILAQDDVTNGQITNVAYTVAYMTLQGGSTGIHVDPLGKQLNYLQITNTPWRNLVFRNQEYGIHLDSFYGFDNNFFFNLNFVDCTKGFYQEAQTRPIGQTGEWPQMMYVDKTIFYQCQFINCSTGIDMKATRANNLDAWIDCNFDGNDIAMYNSSSNALYCVNTVFKNQTGEAVFKGNAAMGFFSCDFTNNSTSSLFDKYAIYAEGCNFNDTNPFNSKAYRVNREFYLWNNNMSNSLDLNYVLQGCLINNTFTNNTDFNKLMIEVTDGETTTLLDSPSDTYPQLLVKQ